MPKRESTYAEVLAILRRLAGTPRPSQEVVAEELHCRKKKVTEALRAFRNMSWEEASAFCGGDDYVLALRPDYVDQKVQEASRPLRVLDKLHQDLDKLRREDMLPECGSPRDIRTVKGVIEEYLKMDILAALLPGRTREDHDTPLNRPQRDPARRRGLLR